MMLSHPKDSRVIATVRAETMQKLLEIRRILFQRMFYKLDDTSERGFEIICKVIQMQ